MIVHIQGIAIKHFRLSSKRTFLKVFKNSNLLSTLILIPFSNKQVIGGLLVIIMLPLVAQSTQTASSVFTHFETSPESTGISSIPYAVVLSVLLSNYCLYGYDAAAHLTEETKGADKTGPIAILSCIGIISVFGWAYYLALTFSIQVCSSES